MGFSALPLGPLLGMTRARVTVAPECGGSRRTGPSSSTSNKAVTAAVARKSRGYAGHRTPVEKCSGDDLSLLTLARRQSSKCWTRKGPPASTAQALPVASHGSQRESPRPGRSLGRPV